MTIETTVTRVLVPEDQRLAITEELFGTWFPMRLEPFIYTITERLSKDYNGGYWEFYTLSNGGFYMTPLHRSAFSRDLSEPFRWQPVGRCLGDYGMSVRL